MASLLAAALLWPALPALADFTQQGPKLVGNDAANIPYAAQQGISVAVSADGNTALVGGWFDHNQAGAAWVFTRSGGVWTQQGSKLVGNDAIGGANQGLSVALSADGNTAIVGGSADAGAKGAAWVFTRSGGVWTQQGPKLFGMGGTGSPANQGISVALSADGNTALVGGWGDNINAGAAWVFTRSGGVWAQQGSKLVGNDATGKATQGHSVALSADGNTAILGGDSDNGGVGAAWVFTRSGGVWTQQGNKLVGTGGTGQGVSVALSSDGNTAMVGGPDDNSNAGAAWVFTRIGGMWTQQGNKLVGNDAATVAHQGASVALSGSGNTAILGGWGDNTNVGAEWVFTRSGGVWSQQGNKLVGTGAAGLAKQGISVALSCSTAVVGGYTDNANAGAAWVFDAPRPPQGTHDFNGDCMSDILWWNSSTGQVVEWQLDGTMVLPTSGSPGFADPTAWVPFGQRDFNGDGVSDILWYNLNTGQVVIWLLNGTTVLPASGSPGGAPRDWLVAGTGDFNGDGMGDILWFNTTSGQVVFWLMNGATTVLPTSGSPGSAPKPWTVAGVGDFNGDGMSDILWYNPTTGQVVLWFMNGTTVLPTSGSPGSAPSPWLIVGTGDFNGDGFSDIVWYNTTTGQVVLWLLNGTTVLPTSGSPGSAAPDQWFFDETGDFNGDGFSDILWRNRMNGQVVLWLLNGTSALPSSGSPGSAAPNPWLIPPFNAD